MIDSKHSPYLDARREWNERYGSYIAQARQWRLVALLCVLALIVAVGGAFYFAQRSLLIPYVVEVGREGTWGYLNNYCEQGS